MPKLTPEQLAAIIERSRLRLDNGDTPALLDHIKALEEENARYKEALEKAFKECQKTTFNDCGELRAKVYDILYGILKGADEE